MNQDKHAVAATFALTAKGLTKRYDDVLAVDEFSLDLRAGEFFGLLGPNGSGKTSTVHILATLIRATDGSATVAGFDVRRNPVAVRARIGVVFQESALDRSLSVDENLRFAGRLYNLTRAEITRRTDELLGLFNLREKRDQPVATLSGGMRRALDIARGVIHRPTILFLDEPTVGLDLPNRRAVWDFIGRLRRETGMTVFLTTHYLEEAASCDRVSFIKTGRVVKSGTPNMLIENLASYILEIESDNLNPLAARLAQRLGRGVMDGRGAMFRFHGDGVALTALQAELMDQVTALRVRRPNLNDVFLWCLE